MKIGHPNNNNFICENRTPYNNNNFICENVIDFLRCSPLCLTTGRWKKTDSSETINMISCALFTAYNYQRWARAFCLLFAISSFMRFSERSFAHPALALFYEKWTAYSLSSLFALYLPTSLHSPSEISWTKGWTHRRREGKDRRCSLGDYRFSTRMIWGNGW